MAESSTCRNASSNKTKTLHEMCLVDGLQQNKCSEYACDVIVWYLFKLLL